MISPETLLKDLVPYNNRRKVWKRLTAVSGLKLPVLEVPLSVQIAKFIFFSIVALCSYNDVFHISKVFGIQNKAVLMLPLIPAVLINYAISAYCRNRLPVSTMRELTLKVLALNFKTTATQGITKNDVEQIINNILVDMAGIDRNEIAPEKSFVKDLGIN